MGTGRQRFKKNKGLLKIFVGIFNLLPKFLLIFLWDSTTNHRQILFIGLRYVILKSLIKSCGDNVRIGPNVQILGWRNLTLESNISVHANCYIDATGGVSIGNDVSLAHNSTILSSNHNWENKELPIKFNPLVFDPVKIESDVWIGCAVRILAGVHIHSRAIVAAGAVVNNDVESNVIVGGIPARKLKDI